MQNSLKKLLAVLMVVTTSMPCRGYAAASTETASNPQPMIRDVELGTGGVAQGLVIDSEGRPVANVVVALHTNDEVMQVSSDETGMFSVAELDGGPCIVQVGDDSFGCRLWANGTAPPKSLQSFSVVSQADAVVRGQSDANADGAAEIELTGGVPPDKKGRFVSLTRLSNKQVALLLGVAAAATVAIILAVEDEGDASQ